MKPDTHSCKKICKNLTDSELDQDYADLVNTVQRHTVCNSAYCLRKNSEGVQSCRFKFPIEECENTHIEYDKIHFKNGSISKRPKVVLKRNDTRVNKHQIFHFQAWRANIDIQPIIDYTACLEYIAKYASKSDKLSNVVKEAFTSVVQNLNGTEDKKKVIRELMIKSAGERDFSAQDVTHHIMSLKLVSSSFEVISLSLEGSRKIFIKNDSVDTKPSMLDNYARRTSLNGSSDEIQRSNLLTFVANYTVVENDIRKRKKQVIVRAFPTPYSNPKSVNYPLFCKYQLIKYKPWFTKIDNTWDDEEASDEMFCEKWSSFLQTDLDQALVPNLRRQLSHVEEFFSTENDDLEEELDNNEGPREEWMYITELCNNNT